MASRQIPSDKINLRLMLVSGKTKEFLFGPNDSAADIAQHVYDNWPDDWNTEQYPGTNILRLIYQGRFLHGNVTLGALQLPLGKTTVMHLVARENLPEPNNQGSRPEIANRLKSMFDMAETFQKMLEKANDKAEEIVHTVTHQPEALVNHSSGSKWRSIHQKLLDLYLEECKKEPKCKKLKRGSHLLDKLVKRDNLNTVILNLYPGNDGYSLMLRGRAGIDTETIKLPYEETELLDYIDEEQLPPLLVDLLDRTQMGLFYSGCVIVEVRDYRRSKDASYDSRHVLLRPTAQTMLCDVNAMVNDGRHIWTRDDLQQLESELILHTSEPLCLDPDPAVFIITNKLHHARRPLNSHALRRSVKKYSQAAVNRKRKMAQYAAPPELKLHDFLSHKKSRTAPLPVNLKVGKTCVDMWKQRDVVNAEPNNITVEQFARVLDKPKVTRDNTPVTVEEYTFETERSHGKVNYSRLTILQRLSDEFYMGELYVDRDYVENQSQGSTCKFPLGTKSNVEKYIRQFREIFTEEGRRQVKITHQLPGQQPVVTFTQPVPASAASAQTPAASNQTIIAQGTTITGQLSVGGGEGVRKTPIRLSLSLNPGQTGGLISPQGTPAQSPVAGQAQLTLLSPQQQLTGAQRIRQLGVFSNLQRSGNELPSPGTTSASGHLPTYTQALNGGSSVSVTTICAPAASGAKDTPTPTPTPPPAATPSTPGSRRQSLNEHAQQVTFIQDTSVSNPPTPTETVGYLTTSVAPSVVNIASTPSRQPTINISGLQGLGAVQGLPQNIQVSMCSSGSITIPISMIGSSTMTTNPKDIDSGKTASLQTLVTMTTAAGSSSATITASSAVPFSVPGTVMSSPPGLMSLPIGVHGNLTQIMAGIKGTQGLQPLLLSRMPGQQPVQLLSTPGLAAAPTRPQAPQGVKQSLSSPPPQNTPTGVATGNLSQHPTAQLRPGTQLTQQQLLQLASHQHLQSQLTIQKPQSQLSSGKVKSKKRNSTPPKT